MFLCLPCSLFLSILEGSPLFAEVGAANPNLSLLVTRLRCNALQSFLFIVENNSCFSPHNSQSLLHRRQRADEQNKHKKKCTLTRSPTNPRVARLKSKPTPFTLLTLTFCGTLQTQAIARGRTIGQ